LRFRGYATGGTKEVTVRDALNEALAEELESNQKTFIMGEEVAQYNGAYGITPILSVVHLHRQAHV
jgi:pyruvate dehydrogenase E1 component beta subunit